jgi:hypothetical protein
MKMVLLLAFYSVETRFNLNNATKGEKREISANSQ